jgi:hypothetical protein
MDFIGPFPDNSHVLVIIDTFSRWTELFWCPDATAASACRALLDHFGRFGAPNLIRSDRGPHFVNHVIKDFLAAVGTYHNQTLAYSKEENSIVERINKEINRHLRAFLFDTIDIDQYRLVLPFVQRIINCSLHKSTGAAPAQILFGGRLNLERGILLPFSEDTPLNKTASQIMADIIRTQNQIIKTAQDNLRRRDEERLANQPPTTVFEDGSFVLARYATGPLTRLHTRWQGPLEVMSHKDSEYTLQNLVSKKMKTIHASNLKLFLFDPNRVEPLDIARRDYMEYFIEKVLAHRGDPLRVSSLWFHVKWLNYDDTHNTWEPWSGVRLTDALHAYLRTVNLSRLIPRIAAVEE